MGEIPEKILIQEDGPTFATHWHICHYLLRTPALLEHYVERAFVPTEAKFWKKGKI